MNKDRELEELLRRSMQHHAEHMPVAQEAPAIAVSLRARRRTVTMLVAAAAVVVIAAGTVFAVGVLHLPGGGSGGASASTTLSSPSAPPAPSRGHGSDAPRPISSAPPGPTSAAPSSAAAPQTSGSVASQGLPMVANQFATYDRVLVDASAPECSGDDPQHVEFTVSDVSDAYLCTRQNVTHPDGSTWSAAVINRITGGLEALLVAAGRPDEAGGSGACTTQAYMFTGIVTLHTSAGSVTPLVPIDSCNHVQGEFLQAMQAIRYTEIRTVDLVELEPALAVQLGCPSQWKDEMTLLRLQMTPGRPVALTGNSATMCVYASDGTGAGDFETGRRLTARQLKAINDALAAPSDTSCDATAHTRFAVLTGPDDRYYLDIALDGCGIYGSSTQDRLQPGSDRLRDVMAGMIN